MAKKKIKMGKNDGPKLPTKRAARKTAKRNATERTAGNVAGTMSEGARRSAFSSALKTERSAFRLSGSGE